MFLTCSPSGVYSHSSHLNRRERYLGRFGTWRWERRLRAGANVALVLGRPRVSVRPERVCHCELAGRGQASGAKSPCSGPRPPRPRKNGPRLKDRRDGTSRGVAVCLCFSAIREISRGCYQGAPFGVPPPSLFEESEVS